jgi:hypothetical protein
VSRDRHVFRPPHAPTPAPVDPAVQARKDAVAYLTGERGLVATRKAMGMEPYSYLPTAEGNIAAGILSWSDLTLDELQWVCDEQWTYVTQAVHFPGGDTDGQAKAQATLDAALADLRGRGGSWTPKPDHDRAPLTVPDVPHPGGR